MTPTEVITKLLLAGVQLAVAFEQGAEYLDLAPAERVTPDLVDVARRHKTEIISWLTAPMLPQAPVVDMWPPVGAPTPRGWKQHHEAVFQELQREAIERINRRGMS